MRTIALLGAHGDAVCESCEVADTVLTRLRGLIGRDGIGDGAGMLLSPCSSIHTFFLRFAIDAVFLDRDLRVLDVVSGLRPWKAAIRRDARAVLELAAGAAGRRGIVRGDVLAWGSAPGAAA